jgi:hypothetical protein
MLWGIDMSLQKNNKDKIDSLADKYKVAIRSIMTSSGNAIFDKDTKELRPIIPPNSLANIMTRDDLLNKAKDVMLEELYLWSMKPTDENSFLEVFSFATGTSPQYIKDVISKIATSMSTKMTISVDTDIMKYIFNKSDSVSPKTTVVRKLV